MATRKPKRGKAAARPAARRAKKKVAAPKGVVRPVIAAPVRDAAAESAERRQSGRETLRLRSVEPSFTVNDLERSLRFYTDALGFIVDQRWNSDNGKLIGVMLKAGVCQIGLSQDDWAKGRDRKKGEAMRIFCTTAQDIDALAARIKANGVQLTEGPKDSEWGGGRTLSVDDPDGFHLTFHRPDKM